MRAPTSADVELFHVTQGSGRPIIMLHGLGITHYTWRHLVGPLAKDHQVIQFDLKGHGQSPRPQDARYAVADQARLICDFIRKNGLHEVTLVGHSMGGGVALLSAIELLQEARSRVRSLVLVCSIAYPQKVPLVIRALKSSFLCWAASRLAPPHLLIRPSLEIVCHDSRVVAQDAVDAYAAPLRRPGTAYAINRTAQQLVPDDIDALTARIAAIDVPTLLLWGREDGIVPLHIGTKLNAAIKGSKLVVFDRCGHMPQEELPDRVTAEIADFLAQTEHAIAREGAG